MLSILSYSYTIFFFTSGAAATSSNQNEKLTQQLIKEEEEAMAKMKVRAYGKKLPLLYYLRLCKSKIVMPSESISNKIISGTTKGIQPIC